MHAGNDCGSSNTAAYLNLMDGPTGLTRTATVQSEEELMAAVTLLALIRHRIL